MDDPRFAKLFTDPKFRGVPKKERKVKIDDRFRSMFKDKRFVSKSSVDKRGRPGNYSTKENFEKFYELSDDDDSDSQSKKGEEESKEKRRDIDTLGEVDYARGEAVLTDSSSGESSSDEDDDAEGSTEGVGKAEGEKFDKWGELDHDAGTTDEATRRLAICNMDWDRVGADDLYLALSSFCPAGGRVDRVDIFKSEFGKKRMAEEESAGPAELHRKDHHQGDESPDSDGEVDDEAAEKSGMERVRMYQVNRLKYFYAVAAFNSAKAANAVYGQCDGSEYELSATRFDLRFVPDDMEFESSDLKESCSRPPPADKYKPKLFSTTALSLGKVDLTWDETDPDRAKAMRRAFENDDVDDDDEVNALVAPDSSDDDESTTLNDAGENSEDDNDNPSEDEEAVIAKYRALLAGQPSSTNGAEEGGEKSPDPGDGSGDEGDMEMTFRSAPRDGDKAVDKMTPWEQYLHKKKEKRRSKKKRAKNDDDAFFRDDDAEDGEEERKGAKKVAESVDLSLLAMDSDDDRAHFDYKQIVKDESRSKKSRRRAEKRSKKPADADDADDFRMDLDDPRFSAIFEKAEFNVDPSNPSFKKTRNMRQVIEEKQKRILEGDEAAKKCGRSSKKKAKAVPSPLESLANSVKSKSDRMKPKKRRK